MKTDREWKIRKAKLQKRKTQIQKELQRVERDLMSWPYWKNGTITYVMGDHISKHPCKFLCYA